MKCLQWHFSAGNQSIYTWCKLKIVSVFYSILVLSKDFHQGKKNIFHWGKRSFILNGKCKRCSLKLWILQIIFLALLPKIEPTGWWQFILRLSHSWFLGCSPSPAPVCCPEFRGFTRLLSLAASPGVRLGHSPPSSFAPLQTAPDVSFLMGKAKKTGIVQPGEEKVLESLNCGFPVLEGAARKMGKTFYKGLTWQDKGEWIQLTEMGSDWV